MHRLMRRTHRALLLCTLFFELLQCDEGAVTSGARPPQREAYATAVFANEDYVCGALVLATRLRQLDPEIGRSRELACIVTKEVGQEAQDALRSVGWIVYERELTPHPIPLETRLKLSSAESFEWVYTKLQAWTLPYDKVIMMDSDLLPQPALNIPSLFAKKQLSADINHPSQPQWFNSGLMVIQPRNKTFEEMAASRFSLKSYDMGDQGFLNNFFAGIWKKLHANVIFTSDAVVHANNWKKQQMNSGDITARLREFGGLHYFGFKPWTCAGVRENTFEMDGVAMALVYSAVC
eukprot:gene7384-8795_t